MNADVTDDLSTVAAFLRWVHEHAIDNTSARVVVSERQPHGSLANYLSRSYRLDQIDHAASGCITISQRQRNAYIRVHLMGRDLRKPTERGGGADTAIVTHFAADVDIAGPGHKPADGQVLPPDAGTAVKLIDDTLAPSAILSSGGGLYPIWRLAEIQPTPTDEQRRRIKNVGRRLDAALASHGYHVDATCLDLARIIRPPGVTNHKPGRNPRPVTILRGYLDGAGDYSLDALEQALPELPPPKVVKPSPRRPADPGTDTSAPWTVLDELYTIDDILAADPVDTYTQVDDQPDGAGHMVPAWRRVGSSADYSIKAGSKGALIVWSSTLAARLGIEPGGGISHWQIVCFFAGRDPREAARWSK